MDPNPRSSRKSYTCVFSFLAVLALPARCLLLLPRLDVPQGQHRCPHQWAPRCWGPAVSHCEQKGQQQICIFNKKWIDLVGKGRVENELFNRLMWMSFIFYKPPKSLVCWARFCLCTWKHEIFSSPCANNTELDFITLANLTSPRRLFVTRW